MISLRRNKRKAGIPTPTAERRRKLRWLGTLLAPYRKQVALSLLTLLIATAAGLAPPYLIGLAIDDALLAGNLEFLYVIVGLFLAVTVIASVASGLQTYLVGWVGQRVLRELRRRIYNHLQTMSLGFFSRSRPGVLISRLTNDVDALETLIRDGVVTLVQSLLSLVGVVIVMLLLDAKLALVVFTTLPVLVLGSIIFRIYAAGAYRATRERIADVTAYLQETLSGVRVVRAFGREKAHVRRMGELNKANRDANMKTVYLNAAYFPAVELLSALGTAIILIYGGYQAIDGQIATGVVVAFVGYLNAFFDPIGQISQLYTTYQQGMAALDKIFELLDTEPDLVDKPGALDPGRVRGDVRFDDVWFSYGTGDDDGWALRGIDLDIPAGETVALVGETGAGKSTIAKLVSRFYDPQRGAVSIDGHDVRDLQAEALRAHFGIVPQESFLFSGTVADNIAFGRPEATDDEIRAAADAVGATEFIEALPDGFDTRVGERGVQLSSGERQLLAFARALVADPAILILDEATANIDVRTEARIESGLHKLLTGRTSLIIAHRLSTIRRADRIIVLDHGRIVEQGSHAELLEVGGAYAALYGDWTRTGPVGAAGVGLSTLS